MSEKSLALLRLWGLWLGAFGLSYLLVSPVFTILYEVLVAPAGDFYGIQQPAPQWQFPILFFTLTSFVFAYLVFRVRLSLLTIAFLGFHFLAWLINYLNQILRFKGSQISWSQIESQLFERGAYVLAGLAISLCVCLFLRKVIWAEEDDALRDKGWMSISPRWENLAARFGHVFFVYCVLKMATTLAKAVRIPSSWYHGLDRDERFNVFAGLDRYFGWAYIWEFIFAVFWVVTLGFLICRADRQLFSIQSAFAAVAILLIGVLNDAWRFIVLTNKQGMLAPHSYWQHVEGHQFYAQIIVLVMMALLLWYTQRKPSKTAPTFKNPLSD